MKILITGATGLIGKELGKNLVAKGHELWIVSRNAEKAKQQVPFPCQVIEGDLTKAKTKTIRGIDAVVNLMGESVGGGRWSEARKRRIYESRILGTRHLIESLESTPKIFINASAVGYYGSCGDEEINEEHSAGEDFLSQVCQDWEEELLPLTYGDSTTRVVALRTGMVLSSQGGAMEKLIGLFRKGLGSVLGDGQQWMSWVHIEDVVGMIVHALEHSNVRGAMNMTSPNPVTNKEFTERMARALNVSTGPRAPRLALTTLLGEMSVVVLGSQRALPTVALQTGYMFKHPQIAESLHDVCAPYANGEDYFLQEQFLPMTPLEVFPFFSAAKNLQKITPSILDFKILEEPPADLKVGSDIRYQIKIHGVPVEWKTKIIAWDPPHQFIDNQEKGPYKLWHHTHEFIPLAGGTLMRDRVRYKLPLGFFGALVAGALVRTDVEKIFSFRREYLSEHMHK